MKKLLIIAACVLLCACASNATTRTAHAVVTETSADAVIFTTDDGNDWEIAAADAYALGGDYVITFDTQDTPSIYDDAIIDIR